MRKMFLLFGALALVGVLFVACSDQQDLTSPEDAAFGKNKVTYECPDPVDEQQGVLETTIQDQYLNDKAEKGALENVDNMARNICRDPQDLAAARATYFEFEIEVNKQNVDKLLDGEAGRQEILAQARAFVSGVPYDDGFLIPPEALLPTGGVGVVRPGANDTIWTNNDEAAFVADPGSFTGTEPVVVVLQRLADPTGFGFPIPGYQAFPEAYDFSASVQLNPDGPGAEFWMCVPDEVPVPFENLVIGHDLGNGESEVLPRLVEAYPGQVIDCTNAAYQPVDLVSGAPLWMQLAGQLLQPVADLVLDVSPLNAMYFGGTGLGGRGGSLSPFAPVDADPPYSTMTVNGAGSGTGVITGGNNIDCAWDGTASTGQCQTTVESWVNLGLTATADDGSIFTGWSGACTGTGACVVPMDADKTVTATFAVAQPTLTVGLNGTSPSTGGLYDHRVSGKVFVDDSPDPASEFSCSTGTSPCLVEDIPLGATVELKAEFEAGVDGGVEWAGICDGRSDGATCQFTMTGGALIAGVYFRVGPTLTVNVWNYGGGEGTLTEPNGLTCSAPTTYPAANTCYKVYEVGTQITLTATTTNSAGITLGDPGTDCYATDPYELGQPQTGVASCTFTWSASRTIDAHFSWN